MNDHDLLQTSQRIGDLLRNAREKAGMTIAAAATQLRVPVHVIQSLEDEEWSKLGAPVFVRGQLRNYRELLQLPADAFALPPEAMDVRPSEITPRTYTPKARWMAEQAARRATYVVLTLAFFVVPMWLLTKPYFSRPQSPRTVLDAPSTPARTTTPTTPAITTHRPTAASMAPVMTPSAPAIAGLTLAFTGDSWLEVRKPDGSVLESAMVKGGERRDFRSGDVGRIVIGNAAVAQVSRDGQLQDLSSLQKGNVLRFAVSSDGSIAAQGN